jgi:hypothetical protein
MQCKNHPNRPAEHFCTSCGIPLCSDCTEEVKPGAFYCFQCAMLTSVSEVGTKIKDRREKVGEEKLKAKKKWGPFRYFVAVAAVLIAVMWGVILFGGEKAPAGTSDLVSNERAFLFMVDSAIKRYAHYEGKKFPEQLPSLVPKYLKMSKENLPQLNRFSYQRDPAVGYRLTLARPKAGEPVVVLTPKGVEYKTSPSSGA